MPKPFEAYREGYERGKKDSPGERMAEVTMGMLRDDPGEHFEKGYSDGSAGRKFNPPPEQVRPPAADVNPFDDKVAIKTVCPNCGAVDWFEWKFLGRLKDPICGHSWFAGSGSYALMQLRAVFAAGRKGAKYMNAGINFEGTQIFLKPFGWFCGAVIFGFIFRLPFGLLMIPIQALAALTKARTGSEIAARIVAFVFGAAAFGFFVYTIESQDRQRFQPVQAAVFNPIQTPAPPPASLIPGGTVSAPQAFIYTFHDPQHYTPNWSVASNTGNTSINYEAANLKVQADRDPRSAIMLISRNAYVGDLDASFEFFHSGYGDTIVGLCDFSNHWVVSGVLDTDDTNFLGLVGPERNIQWPPGSIYMQRWVNLRFLLRDGLVSFFADGALKNAQSFRNTQGLRLGLWVASVQWKSGPNITLFHRVLATGSILKNQAY